MITSVASPWCLDCRRHFDDNWPLQKLTRVRNGRFVNFGIALAWLSTSRRRDYSCLDSVLIATRRL